MTTKGAGFTFPQQPQEPAADTSIVGSFTGTIQPETSSDSAPAAAGSESGQEVPDGGQEPA